MTSFFLENTLTIDDTPVFVDHIVQTIESGNVLKESESQTEMDLIFGDCEIYTENVLSGTYKEEDEKDEQEVLSGKCQHSDNSLYTQTIIMGKQV